MTEGEASENPLVGDCRERGNENAPRLASSERSSVQILAPLEGEGIFFVPQLVGRGALVRALQWSHLGCRAVNRCAHDVKSRTTISITSAVSAPRSFCAATWTGDAMSAKVQGWVWDLDLAAQPKLLLLWLANRATDAGVCFPTKRELGKRTGLSERMVRYHLEALARDRDDQGAPRAPC